jgi:hypothetical protein
MTPAFKEFFVMKMNHPGIDENDQTQVIGRLAVSLPRKNCIGLKQIPNNLSRSLEEISAVIEELASSASGIVENERFLNQKVKDSLNLSEDINEVLTFIRKIADETRMWGLNAAIEAARCRLRQPKK